MSQSTKKKYYAVAFGRNPGVYTSWEECVQQVQGFPNSNYKSFLTLSEAKHFLGENGVSITLHDSTQVEKINKEQLPRLLPPKFSTQVVKSVQKSILPPRSLDANKIIPPNIAEEEIGLKMNKYTAPPKSALNKPKNQTGKLAAIKASTATELRNTILNSDESVKKVIASPTQRRANPSVNKEEEPTLENFLLNQAKKTNQPTKSLNTSDSGLSIGQLLKKEMNFRSNAMNSSSQISRKKVTSISAKELIHGPKIVHNTIAKKSVDDLDPSTSIFSKINSSESGRKKNGKFKFPNLFEENLPLNKEQKEVLDIALNGKNIFFTGAAGCGKSHLLHRIKRELCNMNKEVAVTASTGIAAVNIGGCTLHKWAGIGISPDPKVQFKSAHKSAKRWINTEVLIIDEISMISGTLFDMLESFARGFRKNEKPFGGIQLILVGDFFQLPPVAKLGENPPFCFEAKSWKSCIEVTYTLKEIFRQTDPDFIDLLNDIRVGKCTDKTRIILDKAKTNDNRNHTNILPTVLYAKNISVDELNKKKLEELKGELMTFNADDSFQLFVQSDRGNAKLETLLEGCLALKEIELKRNAQVMLLRNISETLVNGSRGVVVDFETISMKKETDLIEVGIDRAWMDNNKKLPVVAFANGETVTISPEKFSAEIPDEGVAQRIQIPLKLAYALTIHKSQGLTIDIADISLAGVFEYGQAYVALSRLRGLKGLKLLNWSEGAIKANPKVLKFFGEMEAKELEGAVEKLNFSQKIPKQNIQVIDLEEDEFSDMMMNSDDPVVAPIKRKFDESSPITPSKKQRIVYPSHQVAKPTVSNSISNVKTLSQSKVKSEEKKEEEEEYDEDGFKIIMLPITGT